MAVGNLIAGAGRGWPGDGKARFTRRSRVIGMPVVVQIKVRVQAS